LLNSSRESYNCKYIHTHVGAPKYIKQILMDM
jgi:hypothetical protein